MQKDLPIGDPSTFTIRGPSSVCLGTEWVFGSGINISAQSLSHSATMLDNKPTLLQVDLSQFTMEGQELKALFLGGGLTSTSPTHLAMMPPPKAESQVSMTMEVSELLLQAALDTSSQVLGSSSLKRPVSPALGAPPSLRPEGFAKPVDTSSQASQQGSIPDDAEPDDLTLEEISLPVKSFGLGTSILPGDVIQLQEEAGKALGWLLATRSSLNAHQRKQVSDFEMALCQNKLQTTEAIKEARTLCTHTIREAEAHQVKLISKAKAKHTTCIKEAKAEVGNCCSAAIRKAESCDTKQACSIQQTHAKGMQHLETEAIGEEGKDHLSFLATYRAALLASPLKGHGVLVTPFHLLLGNVPLSTLLNVPPQYLPLDRNLPHLLLILLPPWHLGPQPYLSSDTPPLARLFPHLNWKPPQEWPPRSHPT